MTQDNKLTFTTTARPILTSKTNVEVFKFTIKNIDMFVKKDFQTACPNWEKEPVENIALEYNVEDYIHNIEGPAVINNNTNEVLYYINGKLMEKDEWEKERHKVIFNNKMENIVNE